MTPGTVPDDWSRSRSEQYFTFATTLRRGNLPPEKRQILIDGIKAIGATSHGPIMQARCRAVVETEQARAA
jgi:hypothetical protein